MESSGVTPKPPFPTPSFPRNPGSKFAHSESLIRDGDELSSPSWRNCKNERDIVSDAGPTNSSAFHTSYHTWKRTHPIGNHQDNLDLQPRPPKPAPQTQQLLSPSASFPSLHRPHAPE